jgi:hypothetical protein
VLNVACSAENTADVSSIDDIAATPIVLISFGTAPLPSKSFITGTLEKHPAAGSSDIARFGRHASFGRPATSVDRESAYHFTRHGFSTDGVWLMGISRCVAG